MNKSPIIILRNILEVVMGLTANQIYIYNQDFKIPQTSGLFIVLQNISSKPYASNLVSIPVDGGMQETTTMLTKEIYAINLFSKTTEARDRKEEAMMALNSGYALEQKELYQFRFATLMDEVLNISEIEGAGMLNRFVFNVQVNAWYSVTRSITYYDQFSDSILVDNLN